MAAPKKKRVTPRKKKPATNNKKTPVPKGTRPGAVKGRPQATREIMQERVALAAELLARHAFTHQINDAFRKKYADNMPSRTIAEYVMRARKAYFDRSKMSKDDAIAESLATYTSVIRSAKSTNAERLRAQELIDRLLGLRAPEQKEFHGLENTIVVGGDLTTVKIGALEIADSETISDAFSRLRRLGVVTKDASGGN